MSCCPPNSLPSLTTNYDGKGKEITTEELEYYITGTETKRAIIFGPDVWGWRGGRTRWVADKFAETVGATVLVPKTLLPPLEGGTDGEGLPPDFDVGERGEDFGKWAATLPWDSTQLPLFQKALDVVKGNGAEKIGMAGFCWGGWTLIKFSQSFPGVLSAGTIAHPSCQVEEWIFQGDTAACCETVDFPLLLLPAGNDPDEYRNEPNVGSLFAAFSKNSPMVHCMNTEFKDAIHGWTTRGDISDPNAKKLVELAVDSMISHFKKYL